MYCINKIFLEQTVLFNLCLEPLIDTINTIYTNEGYSVRENKVKIHVYSDAIILVADNPRNMNFLLETCPRFC